MSQAGGTLANSEAPGEMSKNMSDHQALLHALLLNDP